LRRHVRYGIQDTWLLRERFGIILLMDVKTHRAEIIAGIPKKPTRIISSARLPEGYKIGVNEDANQPFFRVRATLNHRARFLTHPRNFLILMRQLKRSIPDRTLIQEAMGKLMKGRTSFVIAPRLSTIRDADSFCHESRNDYEKGTHQIASCGPTVLSDLYNSQFADGAITKDVETS